MKWLLSALGLVLLCFSCRNGGKQPVPEYNNDSIPFYPVKAFIDSQIALVNQTPYFLYKITEQHGRRDSAAIGKADFNRLASLFLAYDISDRDTKKYYRESAFHDASTQSITISYSTAHPSLPLRSVDVLLDESGQQVKRIFLNILQPSGDSTVSYKMGWKPNERFFVNRIVNYENGRESVQQNTVVWNDKK